MSSNNDKKLNKRTTVPHGVEVTLPGPHLDANLGEHKSLTQLKFVTFHEVFMLEGYRLESFIPLFLHLDSSLN